jgi:hypothetical protein
MCASIAACIDRSPWKRHRPVYRLTRWWRKSWRKSRTLDMAKSVLLLKHLAAIRAQLDLMERYLQDVKLSDFTDVNMKKQRKSDQAPALSVATPEKAGYAIKPWCAAVGISVALFFELPIEMQPSSVRIGRRRLITESPSDYLSRVQSSGGSVTIDR